MSENHTEPNENHASTTANNDSYAIITEKLVKDGLQNDKGKHVEFLSFERKDFTNKGDGYTSIVTSVTVKYKNKERLLEESYVVKLNPIRPPSPMTDLLKQVFPREEEVLTKIIGGMNEHLERLNLPPIKTPKLFSSNMEMGKEAFVAENLRTQGFLLHDRRNGQDFNHALLVMEELGRFHASSLLLKESIAPKTFVEKYEYFEEAWFDPDHKSFQVFDAMVISQGDGAIKFLKSLPKYEKCVKWLTENHQNLGRFYIDGFKSREPFVVLAHGDCWTNNMLFKYNAMNVPIDMRFVDLQCSRLGSPASDIVYFAYSSLTGEVRSKHLQKLLYVYYQSFSKVLIFARRKVPFTFTDLENEVEERITLGLVIGIMALPIVLAEDDAIMDFNILTEDNTDEFAQKQLDNFERLSEKEGPFKDRFLSLFDEFLEKNFF